MTRKMKQLTLVGVPVLVLIGALFAWLQGGRHITTENAFVKADITQIASEVTGRIAEVRIRDHSAVAAGEVLLRLDRAGYQLALDKADAEKIGVRDNEWIEAKNRNGTVSARAVVSHRIPEGTVFMHHAQDRQINTPLNEESGKRGGTHNSLTRISIKPTHLIGGYAQLSYGFNYYGPTGNQRDELVVVRRRVAEVTY